MKTLLSEAQLREGVDRLAQEVRQCYGEAPLTVVAVMTGSLILLADLIRQLSMPMRVGMIQASSYRGGVERGDLLVQTQMLIDIRDRDVLLVDDIFDTGHTLQRIYETMETHGARSVRSAVLLSKRRRSDVAIRPDFVGFEIPDVFVVGYGLDYRDLYRNLPHVAQLEAEDLAAVDDQRPAEKAGGGERRSGARDELGDG